MKTLRIKDKQEEDIRLLAIKLNKKLVEQGKQPLRDSELMHILINEAIKRADITTDGRIEIK